MMTIIQSISQAIASEGSCDDLEVVVTKPQMMPGGAIQVEDWEDYIYDVDTINDNYHSKGKPGRGQ